MPLKKLIFTDNLPALTNIRKAEDAKKGSLFMSRSVAEKFCVYLNEDGNLCFENNMLLDSTLSIKNKIKENPFKFIITLQGEILAAPKYDIKGNKITGPSIDNKMDAPSVKHSTLCQGGNVLFGGELYFQSGKIIKITNESGHYVPNLHAFHRVLHYFAKLGVMTESHIKIARCFPLTQRKEPVMFWSKGLQAFEKRFSINESKIENKYSLVQTTRIPR